jgi:hypothetical protein
MDRNSSEGKEREDRTTEKDTGGGLSSFIELMIGGCDLGFLEKIFGCVQKEERVMPRAPPERTSSGRTPLGEKRITVVTNWESYPEVHYGVYDVVAIEPGIHYYQGVLEGSSTFRLNLLTEDEKREWLTKAEKRGGPTGSVEKMSVEDYKNLFARLVLNMLQYRQPPDPYVLQKIYSVDEIRQRFPQLAHMFPETESDVVQRIKEKCISLIEQGLREDNIALAIPHFKKASTKSKKALTLGVSGPSKLELMSLTSLSDGLVALCEGFGEKDRVYFEGALNKFEQATEIIPSMSYPYKLICRAFYAENESEKKELIDRTVEAADSLATQSLTSLESSLLSFLRKLIILSGLR